MVLGPARIVSTRLFSETDETAYKASIERPEYPVSLIPVIRK